MGSYDASQSADERTQQYLAGSDRQAREAREIARSQQVPEGFPAGWSQDTRAPFTTYYDEEGMLGVTRDEDNSNLWFAMAYDETEEIHKPLAADGSLMDWDTRPAMFDTPQEALAYALRSAS